MRTTSHSVCVPISHSSTCTQYDLYFRAPRTHFVIHFIPVTHTIRFVTHFLDSWKTFPFHWHSRAHIVFPMMNTVLNILYDKTNPPTSALCSLLVMIICLPCTCFHDFCLMIFTSVIFRFITFSSIARPDGCHSNPTSIPRMESLIELLDATAPGHTVRWPKKA